MTSASPRLKLEREIAAAFPGTDPAGVDEAGRGPLAGPVFAAAVSVPLEKAEELAEGAWKRVTDSKKLPAPLREELAAAIRAEPDCLWSVASASVEEIDRLNILRATHLAMRRACLGLIDKGGQAVGFAAIVDGLPVKGLPFPSRNAVKGDMRSLLAGAASILAKTGRDAYCMQMDAKWPGYGFAANKGYGTRGHLNALSILGPCPEHRKSFAPVREQLLPGFDVSG